MTFPPNNQLMFDITSKIKREIHDELSVNGIIFNIQNKGGNFGIPFPTITVIGIINLRTKYNYIIQYYKKS